MKSINRILASICFIGSLFSCADDYLETKPLSIFTPESIYVDEAGFEGVLVTLRKNLRTEFYGQTGGIACELIASDIAISANKGSDALHNFDTQLMPTGSGAQYDTHQLWETAYNQIKNANVILSRIEAADLKDEVKKKAILAEAYFHRAYWYYRLVHVYGDVPFLSHEYTTPKIDFYTHSRKAILKKIEEDLSSSVQDLPVTVIPGAVSKGAGYHLLAKICLANGDFQAAVDAASNVIESGNYQLMTERFGIVASDPTYNVIWDLHQKENKSSTANKEGLLVVQDRYGYPDAEVTGGTKMMRKAVPCWWNKYIKDPDGVRGCMDTEGDPQMIKIGRGVGYVRPCSYFNYEIWKDPTDLRHDKKVNWFSMDKLCYNAPGSKYFGQPVQKELINPKDTIHCWFPFPYYKIYVADEEQPNRPVGGHSDWYVFRLAETYLVRAEAYFWLNQKDKAATDINAIRLRSKAAPITASEVTIDYILDERARELYMEEPRKTELTRIAYLMAEQGINGYSLDNFSEKNFWYDRVMAKNEFYKAGNILWGSGIYKISPFHVLWPIPAKAIDSNLGGVINQNIGYVGAEKNIEPLTVIDDSQ